VAVVNPDDIFSAVYARLYGDSVFRSMVRSIDKGTDRVNPPPGQNRPVNPSATIHVLTAAMDPETDTVYSTVVVNVFMDALPTGQMDTDGLGQRAHRIAQLFHKAHFRSHALGQWQDPKLRFHSVYVEEPVFGQGHAAGEHMASVRISLIVQAKE